MSVNHKSNESLKLMRPVKALKVESSFWAADSQSEKKWLWGWNCWSFDGIGLKIPFKSALFWWATKLLFKMNFVWSLCVNWNPFQVTSILDFAQKLRFYVTKMDSQKHRRYVKRWSQLVQLQEMKENKRQKNTYLSYFLTQSKTMLRLPLP